MSHSAEIIAVGTELLLGNITNTNAQGHFPGAVRRGRERVLAHGGGR